MQRGQDLRAAGAGLGGLVDQALGILLL